jgi:hypothetical protein
MITTTIWGIQTRVKNMHALFLEERKSIHIPEEEERVGEKQKPVRNLNLNHF